MKTTCLICGTPTANESEQLCAQCVEAVMPKRSVESYFEEERELYYSRERERSSLNNN